MPGDWFPARQGKQTTDEIVDVGLCLFGLAFFDFHLWLCFAFLHEKAVG